MTTDTGSEPRGPESRGSVVPLRRASIVPDEAIRDADADARDAADAADEGAADDHPPTAEPGRETDGPIPIVDLAGKSSSTDREKDNDLGDLAMQAARTATGFAIGAMSLTARALRQSTGAPDRGPDRGKDDPTPTPALLAGAALAMASDAAIAAERLLRELGGAAGAAASPVSGPLRTVAAALDERWRRRAEEAERAAERAADAGVPDLARAVLDRLDLTALVMEHVDLDEIVRGVDPNVIADRIDVDRIVARLDVDAIVERVDIDAVIARIDLAGLAREVIEELDLSELIRESAGGLTGETVDEIRIESAKADRAVARAIDRVLRRRDREQDGEERP